LEDTYGEHTKWRARVAIARAGLVERARETGLVFNPTSSNDRLRSGSHLVLCGWSLFMVAGAIFAKFTEHWGVATPMAHRTLPRVGDLAVQWAGGVGMVLVLLAGVFVLPAVIASLRHGGWSRVRRPVLRGLTVVSTALLLTGAMAIWSRFLNNHQRNGSWVAFEIVVLLCALVFVAAIITATSAAITVTRQIDLSRKALLVLSSTALAVTVLMATVTAGTVAWWVSEATYAPQFLRHSIGSGLFLTSSSLPPALLAAGLMMILGLVTALAGARRVANGFRTNTAS
jgi:chromate transport protein ChrA